MRKNLQQILLVAVVCAAILALGPAASGQQEVTEEDIQEAFYPYRDGFPEVPGIRPGMVINKENVEAAEGLIPQEEIEYLKQGWFEIQVEQTHDTPLHPNYIEATRKHAGQAKIGPNGELLNHVTGLPFPKIDPDDPQAGIKAAWNYAYHYWGDQISTEWEWKWINSKGEVTRNVHGTVNTLYSKHRYVVPPAELTPNPRNYFWADHFWISDPYDLKDWQFLVVRFKEDAKDDDTWFYVPQLRRVKRSTTSIRTDSLLGSTWTYDDFHGYNGHTVGFDWKFVGEKVMLAPVGATGTNCKYGGHNNWYPLPPWQLRKVVILERYAKDPNYPFKLWRMYLDKQTYVMYATEQYDAKGVHWKTVRCLWADPDAHLPINKGKGTPMWIGIVGVDYQKMACSTVDQYKSITNEPMSFEEWTVEYMRAGR